MVKSIFINLEVARSSNIIYVEVYFNILYIFYTYNACEICKYII